MKYKSRGITLGQLLLWLLVIGLLLIIAHFGHAKYQKYNFIQELESHLSDAKIRLNATIISHDKTATYGDILNKCETNLAEIEKNIISIEKLDNRLDQDHFQAAKKILVAARDVFRSQRQMARVHIKGRGLMASLDKLIESKDNDLAAALLSQHQERANSIAAELSVASAKRIESLQDLVDATISATSLFHSETLIDTSIYLASIDALYAGMNQSSGN